MPMNQPLTLFVRIATMAAVVILPFTHFLAKDPLTLEYIADE